MRRARATVSGVSDFFQISRASRSEFATRLLPGQDKPAPSVQNQLIVNHQIVTGNYVKDFEFNVTEEEGFWTI